MMHPQRMMNQGPPRISMIPPSNGSPHFISVTLIIFAY